MFKNKRFKKVIVSTLAVLMLVSTVAFAAEVFEKKVTTTQGRIKMSYDGKDVTKQIESKYGTPAFTVKDYDSRAYVPVRALAEVMGIEVDYNHETDVANFTDNEKKVLKEQVASKNTEIAKLKAELSVMKLENKDLKEELEKEEEEEEKKTDIEDLEEELNKDYGVVDNVSFDILLKESKDRITANITIDTRDSYERSAWRRMDRRKREAFMEDIAKDIEDVFNGYKIEGSIYDNYKQYTAYEFTMNTSGRVIINSRDYRDDDLIYDAEYYLESNFDREARVDIEDIDIRERSSGEIYGDITIDSKDKLPSDRNIENAFYYTEDDLRDEFGDDIYLDIRLYHGDERIGYYRDGRWD